MFHPSSARRCKDTTNIHVVKTEVMLIIVKAANSTIRSPVMQWPTKTVSSHISLITLSCSGVQASCNISQHKTNDHDTISFFSAAETVQLCPAFMLIWFANVLRWHDEPLGAAPQRVPLEVRRCCLPYAENHIAPRACAPCNPQNHQAAYLYNT